MDLKDAKVKDLTDDSDKKEISNSKSYKFAVISVLVVLVILIALSTLRSSQAWYWILYLALGIWVLSDTLKRKNNNIGWPIGTFLLGPIVLPIYLAKRNLREGEIREGGTGWNILKYFGLLWTLTMVVVTVISIIKINESAVTAVSKAERTGIFIGSGIGFMLIVMIWFIPAVSALILGLFLKKSSIIEKGPTGEKM